MPANPAALERLKMHKSKGDKVVLCSASFDMLLRDFADYLKVDLISTKLKRVFICRGDTFVYKWYMYVRHELI